MQSHHCRGKNTDTSKLKDLLLKKTPNQKNNQKKTQADLTKRLKSKLPYPNLAY